MRWSAASPAPKSTRDICSILAATASSLKFHLWRIFGERCWAATSSPAPRLSRIYYKSKFFQYPLEPMNALLGLGIVESIRCGFSYIAARLFPEKPETNLEAWVSNRFGRRLFGIFFKSYTEKVWGIPCRQIGAEWAAQRIRGLSFTSMIWNAIRPKKRQDKQGVIKTLVHEFQYPRKGPGMMWNKTRDIVESRGCRVELNTPVDRIRWEPGRVISVHAGGREYQADHFISTMPIRQLIECLDPAPPAYLVNAARDFKYRDFLTTCLICKGTNLFPDNWIYVHDPKVRVGRIQNYGNWSPEMVPDPDNSCLGMEYFCNQGDDLWKMRNDDLIALGRKELAQLGLAPEHAVVDGTVLRIPKAYPVYDETYQRGLDAIRHVPQGNPQHATGGAQRHAPLQQPGSLHAHRGPRRAQHPGRELRPLAGERRRRVSRERRRCLRRRAEATGRYPTPGAAKGLPVTMDKTPIVILGAGPAGLGAAYRLSRRNAFRLTVAERQTLVGGNAGSFDLAGLPVDYGSHRLHPSCAPEILDDIRGFLGDALLDRPRHGRIRLSGRWVHFPLKPADLALHLPLDFSLGVARDLALKPFASRTADTFAAVLERGLGRTICRDFYFPYARKIWGVPPEELDAEQARRRVSAGSLGKMARKILNAVPGVKKPGAGRFFYPRDGYGAISRAYYCAARKAGVEVMLGAPYRLSRSTATALPPWWFRTAKMSCGFPQGRCSRPFR